MVFGVWLGLIYNSITFALSAPAIGMMIIPKTVAESVNRNPDEKRNLPQT
ncbi:MAG: hypothetical protein M1151_05515 [Candidatus Thermoplasmatota archaeon]|nr:hypothetical protein [Candidatus Thermoplasmatota archaeon]